MNKLFTEQTVNENYKNFMDVVNYLDERDKEKFKDSYRDKFADIRFKLDGTETYKNAVIYVTRKVTPAKRNVINVALWCKPVNVNVINDTAGKEGYTIKTKTDGFMIVSANIPVNNDMPENVAEVFTVLRNI